MKSEQEFYDELAFYTLAHGDPRFIHQHIVDAFAAQTADKKTKPIAVAFALAGLYLYLEKNFTGKEVQRAHMKMAKKKRPWPLFEIPHERGSVRVFDVVNAAPGKSRDEAIKKWCISVWQSWHASHKQVADFVDSCYSDPYDARHR